MSMASTETATTPTPVTNDATSGRQRLDVLFQKGDRVMVHIQGRHMDVCHGSSVTRAGVDHVFISSSRALPVGACADQVTNDMIWCIEKTSYKNAMAKARTNIRHLLLGSLPAKSNPQATSKQGQQRQQVQGPLRNAHWFVVCLVLPALAYPKGN